MLSIHDLLCIVHQTYIIVHVLVNKIFPQYENKPNCSCANVMLGLKISKLNQTFHFKNLNVISNFFLNLYRIIYFSCIFR